MSRKRVQTVMTYEDWCKAHRKTLKKMVHDTVSYFFHCIVLAIMFSALPFGMIVHWLLFGY